ncbi:lysine-sensitive aspartokinase 3 [Psittacicella hinzii]|uniref:Aspartokinase n=1 Tax=Psittacicella hinzii TaxID=2028575 RepID=A0A3A1YME0_9GAMM|nr:lysine-sensitive aspartokinase 3 [Psittacicella hinzii]RIY39463.1 lysine-sensitive aspartokinase 3 [Psittacicella hinzii]
MSQDYIVAKFGGTSVADYDAMLNCFNIINANPQVKVVILSASAGVTNLLVELAAGCDKNKRKELLEKIRLIQFNIINRLQFPEEIANKIESCLRHITSLSEAASLATNEALAAAIVAHGELMSTMIFTHLCKEQGCKVEYLDAREVIYTTGNFSEATVDLDATLANAHKVTSLIADGTTKVITQGFISSQLDEGKTAVLGRGGSDYSAALFAEIINAKECHIWTDVAGIYTTDPRIVANAQRIEHISFKEAAEMAIFGAKVLHPATILPAVRSNIPVFIGNSKNPDLGGTWVTQSVDNPPLFRGIACKRNQSLLTISSLKMLGTSGFLSKVFNIFTKYNVVVDCVTTSEVAIAITLDHKQNKGQALLENPALITELEELGKVKIEHDYSLIALIGNNLTATKGVASALETLDSYPIRMICQGASDHNICVLVKADQADNTIKSLHAALFEK